MNFAVLSDMVLRWANRPEIEPAVASFFVLVDADLKRRLSDAGVAGGEGRDTATLTAGDDYSTAPEDLGRVIRMIRTSDGGVIEAVSDTALAAARAADPDGVGRPRMFAVAGGGFRYYPTPDADTPVELTYQRRHEGLSSANTSNWISLRHPDVYLAGVLAQAGLYLADDVSAARWGGLYDRAVNSLIGASAIAGPIPEPAPIAPTCPLVAFSNGEPVTPSPENAQPSGRTDAPNFNFI